MRQAEQNNIVDVKFLNSCRRHKKGKDDITRSQADRMEIRFIALLLHFTDRWLHRQIALDTIREGGLISSISLTKLTKHYVVLYLWDVLFKKVRSLKTMFTHGEFSVGKYAKKIQTLTVFCKFQSKFLVKGKIPCKIIHFLQQNKVFYKFEKLQYEQKSDFFGRNM